MKVHQLEDESGRVFAFEVEVTLSGRRGVCSIIKRIPGATLTRKPRLFSWFREQSFCEFEISGVEFEAEEPFGDNSRYWVGPKDSRWHPEIELVLEAFSGKPSPA